MRPVDSHCHLDFENFDEDRDEVIGRAKDVLDFVVNAGSNFEHNEKSLELESETDGFVVANLGLHPTYTESFDEIDRIKKQIRENDPVAIGEIGLDHHHVTESESRDEQEKVFREMLDLAEELGKPVVLHTRDAEKRTVEILGEYDLKDVMLHCFNGAPELAEEAVEKGYFIGVTTQVLYSNRVQEIVDRIGLEKLLLETDSPFLYRGERNEPVNVKESAEKIAEIKETNYEKVVEASTVNARKIFR
ncbi:TatD family hydrolase [Candidatus Nanosalina sp. VS9-1]|uniref:TatD family hydrolase n=1 Tax=Candidatus Nanosalina sp. VS9-1 TaxID=3388566 RepID=UPI0039E0500C